MIRQFGVACALFIDMSLAHAARTLPHDMSGPELTQVTIQICTHSHTAKFIFGASLELHSSQFIPPIYAETCKVVNVPLPMDIYRKCLKEGCADLRIETTEGTIWFGIILPATTSE